jgi:cell wall-associated NlpC family hydrolase
MGDPIPTEALQPGDLVFYNTLQRHYSHVGIYLGKARFVHAPASGGAVRIEDMHVSYWASRYDGARRVAFFRAADARELITNQER